MCGQYNYLGTVTSYDMNESEMGYRGSKSSVIALVKEQRVDGSYSFQVELLRCTLMAPERGYQTEILSNKKIMSLKMLLLCMLILFHFQRSRPCVCCFVVVVCKIKKK